MFYGAYGNSMSKRAQEAYKNGEKPWSKWTKKDIVEKVEEKTKNAELINLVKTCNTDVLRTVLLFNSSWHHSSPRYNQTIFFVVKNFELEGEEKIIIDLQRVKAEDKKKREEAKKNKQIEAENITCYRAYVKYKLSNTTSSWYNREVGIIQGNWCYLQDGHRRSLKSKYFEVLERYEDLPKDLDVKNITDPKYEKLFENPHAGEDFEDE